MVSGMAPGNYIQNENAVGKPFVGLVCWSGLGRGCPMPCIACSAAVAGSDW